jgi:hypothetical protein
LFDILPEKWPEIDEDLIDDIGEKKRSWTDTFAHCERYMLMKKKYFICFVYNFIVVVVN